jgi:hypothetical protein
MTLIIAQLLDRQKNDLVCNNVRPSSRSCQYNFLDQGNASDYLEKTYLH